jgi:hypothetical protein
MTLGKYLIVIQSENGKVKSFTQFKTRGEIVKNYKIPLYMVDKIIKINNDVNFTSKRDSQMIFKSLIQNFKIYLIKPTYLIN